MPYFFNNLLKDDEDNSKANISGASPTTDSEGNAQDPNNGNGGSSNGSKPVNSGSGFQNLDKYFQANQGNQLGNQVLGKVQNSIDTAKQNQNTAADTFTKQVQGANNVPTNDQITNAVNSPGSLGLNPGSPKVTIPNSSGIALPPMTTPLPPQVGGKLPQVVPQVVPQAAAAQIPATNPPANNVSVPKAPVQEIPVPEAPIPEAPVQAPEPLDTAASRAAPNVKDKSFWDWAPILLGAPPEAVIAPQIPAIAPYVPPLPTLSNPLPQLPPAFQGIIDSPTLSNPIPTPHFQGGFKIRPPNLGGIGSIPLKPPSPQPDFSPPPEDSNNPFVPSPQTSIGLPPVQPEPVSDGAQPKESSPFPDPGPGTGFDLWGGLGQILNPLNGGVPPPLQNIIPSPINPLPAAVVNPIAGIIGGIESKPPSPQPDFSPPAGDSNNPFVPSPGIGGNAPVAPIQPDTVPHNVPPPAPDPVPEPAPEPFVTPLSQLGNIPTGIISQDNPSISQDPSMGPGSGVTPEQYQAWLNQKYGGPDSLQSVSGLSNQFWSGTNQAKNESQLLGNESGRYALLDNYFRRPDYSQGQKSLDNLLLQRSGIGAKTADLQGQAQQLGASGNAEENALRSLASQRAAQVQSSRDYAHSAIGVDENGQVTPGMGALSQEKQQIDNSLAQANKLRGAGSDLSSSALQAALSSGHLDADQLTKLGLPEGLQTWNYNLGDSKYFTPGQDLTANQTMTQDQRARLQALSQMAGIADPYGDNVRNDPMAPGWQFNKDALLGDLSSKEKEYWQQYQNLINQWGSVPGNQTDLNPALQALTSQYGYGNYLQKS